MRILKFIMYMYMYTVEVVIFILHQILVTNIQGNVEQLEGKINNQIVEVLIKGLTYLVLIKLCRIWN